MTKYKNFLIGDKLNYSPGERLLLLGKVSAPTLLKDLRVLLSNTMTQLEVKDRKNGKSYRA
jgi:hypothetical protein